MLASHHLLQFVSLVFPLAFGGCTPLSPQAQCFAEATVAYRAAWREAEGIRAELARGYALHPVVYRSLRESGCGVPGTHDLCVGTVPSQVQIPVSIERAVLEERLTALEKRMETLRPAAMAVAAPCGYGDWSQTYLALHAPPR